MASSTAGSSLAKTLIVNGILYRGLSTSSTVSLSRSLKRINTKAQSKSLKLAKAAEEKLKRRTRSDKPFDANQFAGIHNASQVHIPVMLGEVVDVFSFPSLRSFVDCTIGAAGHCSAIIQAHPELRTFVGMDVDPVALEMAQAKITTASHSSSPSNVKAYCFLKNFKNIKSTLAEADGQLLASGVDGILMDLGMSSMQVNTAARGFSLLADGPLDMRMDPQAYLTAEDILNSWPDVELGRILREYGEESNWRLFQNKIVQARLVGGLHSTRDLVDLIRSTTGGAKGRRQGWIKTAARVFQALRIAVNDELETLKCSLHACFDCLAPGGRLAVISFHSLEDRIVKQAFLSIIDEDGETDGHGGGGKEHLGKTGGGNDEPEVWIRQIIRGRKGMILTKRPITPSEEEEKLNCRCRSAKLRVIQKI